MDAISFKVTSKGVYVNLNPEKNFGDIKKALIQHSNEASNFFAGVELYINPNGLTLTINEMNDLIELLSRYENIENIYFLSEGVSSKSRNMDTILINRTIRSGQLVKYPANVVIIGDVNPGAEVIAGGDILVVGKLRGVVHAGATGGNDSQIIALKLQPTQLRIANIISRSPDDLKGNQLISPERAYIKDGSIIVEELELK
ncbi:MAG: septum site-determining protein MinC [Bacillota bacterium]